MKGYKGFSPDMTCGNKQYKENTIYEEKNVKKSKDNLYFYKNPFEVLNYFPFVNSNAKFNNFTVVEALNECETEDNRKFTTKKLRIIKKIGIDGLIKAFIDFALSKNTKKNIVKTSSCSVSTSKDDYSVSANEGPQSISANTGYYSVSTNTGNYGVSVNTGKCAATVSTGYKSAAIAEGHFSVAKSTGVCSVSVSEGFQSAAINNGYQSVALSTDDNSISVVNGEYSIAIAMGKNSKAKGALGCYIGLAEWREGFLVDFKLHKVDGETIKPNTYYKLENGKFVEC